MINYQHQKRSILKLILNGDVGKSKIKTLNSSLKIISYQGIDMSNNIEMKVENSWEWDKRDLNRGTSAQGQLV
jgi:hypothetical protein